MMRILLITDQAPESNHSAIQGIFAGHLRQFATVDVVYFDRAAGKPAILDGKLVLPHQYRRRRTVEGLKAITDISGYDFIIVRNLFAVLRNLLAGKKDYRYRLGFWESFPHSFRRIYEARATGRAVWRKRIEYAVKQHLERRLIEQCDFYLPITETYRRRFYPDLRIPCHPLSMGVDFSRIQPARHSAEASAVKKFIYIGSVDRLRRLDLIISAFRAVKGDFVFDLYTPSDNDFVRELRSAEFSDERIRICPPKPRDALFDIMGQYDVGIGLIPESPLYEVSSPTKTLEYYAVGIPAIINHLPEYSALFDENSAFFCSLTPEAIQDTVARILTLEGQKIRHMGEAGKRIVAEKRDYAVMAESLFRFLQMIHAQTGLHQ